MTTISIFFICLTAIAITAVINFKGVHVEHHVVVDVSTRQFKNFFKKRKVKFMGTTEMTLVLKYGVPLAAKLLANGKAEAETVEAVNSALVGLSDDSLTDAVVNADEEQAASIVDALYNVVVGAGDAVQGIIDAVSSLFWKKPEAETQGETQGEETKASE